MATVWSPDVGIFLRAYTLIFTLFSVSTRMHYTSRKPDFITFSLAMAIFYVLCVNKVAIKWARALHFYPRFCKFSILWFVT
jgi:hypothetical protein